MDRRRRFVPAPDGLEGRALLSLLSPPSVTAIKNQLNATTTVSGKLIRIEQLPNFFRSIVVGRVVPKPLVSRFQFDLEPLIGNLHAASTPAKVEFERALRDTVARATVSSGDVVKLDRAFGHFLRSTGATPQEETNLRLDLIALSRRDTSLPQSTTLVTNDYAIAAQVAVSIGRPIKTPTAPRLAVADSLGGKGGRRTVLSQPHLVGGYDPSSTIQVLSPTGDVLGQGQANVGGNYSVKLAVPLSPGTYVLRVRAIDEGFVSPVSPPLTLSIVPRRITHAAAVPAGPKALTGAA